MIKFNYLGIYYLEPKPYDAQIGNFPVEPMDDRYAVSSNVDELGIGC